MFSLETQFLHHILNIGIVTEILYPLFALHLSFEFYIQMLNNILMAGDQYWIR